MSATVEMMEREAWQRITQAGIGSEDTKLAKLRKLWDGPGKQAHPPATGAPSGRWIDQSSDRISAGKPRRCIRCRRLDSAVPTMSIISVVVAARGAAEDCQVLDKPMGRPRHHLGVVDPLPALITERE